MNLTDHKNIFYDPIFDKILCQILNLDVLGNKTNV